MSSAAAEDKFHDSPFVWSEIETMWFEILPSIGVIFGALCLGQAATAFVPNLILGRPGMKRLFHPYEFDNYLRDQQLTGSPYKLQGLEAIPDEVEADKK